uniref:Endoplasmic reticulum vesicle transporter C-terminal domain-containing protein n=1 Tax=Globisporangium ultimum (strain ATCC 200006 / CBS 805.95 / DAOM BR144) TaxID=431595 RepID=K3WDM7_GLOUD
MVVDSTLNEKLQINLDISFLALSCKDAHINAMDVAGDLQMDMYQTIKKTRLDRFGNAIERVVDVGNADKKGQTTPPGYCGSCYDAKHPAGKKCCNTCDEVKEAFMASDMALEEAEKKEQCIRESNADEMLAQDGEGCRFEGNMLVNRVAGNFHVALGRTFHREGRLVHQFRPGQEMTFNASHIVHSLSFGTPYPGSIGPLDGTVKITESIGGVFQYFIKVVPTIYSDISSKVHSYQ